MGVCFVVCCGLHAAHKVPFPIQIHVAYTHNACTKTLNNTRNKQHGIAFVLCTVLANPYLYKCVYSRQDCYVGMGLYNCTCMRCYAVWVLDCVTY